MRIIMYEGGLSEDKKVDTLDKRFCQECSWKMNDIRNEDWILDVLCELAQL